MNVWERGAPAVNGVTCSGPACVLIVQQGSTLSVAVSDPTHQASSTVRLTVPRTAKSTIVKDDRIRVLSLQPAIALEIDLTGSTGASIQATFTVRT